MMPEPSKRVNVTFPVTLLEELRTFIPFSELWLFVQG